MHKIHVRLVISIMLMLGLLTTAPAAAVEGPSTVGPSITEDVGAGGSIFAEVTNLRVAFTTPIDGELSLEIVREDPVQGWGQLFTIVTAAPEASPEEPLQLDLWLSGPLANSNLVLLRDGMPVDWCDDPFNYGTSPDPCWFGYGGGPGLVTYGVLSSQPGTWTIGAISSACPSMLVPDAGFADTKDNVHERAIDCLTWWGVSGGADTTHFAPSQNVTRGQMAAFLSRLMETAYLWHPPLNYNFSDVGPRAAHRTAINQMAALGIINGYSDGTFRPDQPVTRGQMTTMLVNTYEHITGTELYSTGTPFSDIEGNVHAENIGKAVANGLILGRGGSLFDPNNSTTRGQTASVLSRVLDLLVLDYWVGLPLDM
ncbi:MAG: S-layer homology domain-containing protein [Candidatus Saccharimonadales bacterium]